MDTDWDSMVQGLWTKQPQNPELKKCLTELIWTTYAWNQPPPLECLIPPGGDTITSPNMLPPLPGGIRCQACITRKWCNHIEGALMSLPGNTLGATPDTTWKWSMHVGSWTTEPQTAEVWGLFWGKQSLWAKASEPKLVKVWPGLGFELVPIPINYTLW